MQYGKEMRVVHVAIMCAICKGKRYKRALYNQGKETSVIESSIDSAGSEERLSGQSKLGIDCIYPEFELYSKVIADKLWKLGKLTCGNLFVGTY